MSLPQTPIEAVNQAYSMPQQSIAPQANLAMGQQPFSVGDYGGSTLQNSAPMTSGSMDNLFPDSFDMGSLDHFNFDNRYGLAEFGMLNQMSTGMANSPPSDSTGAFNPSGSNYTPGSNVFGLRAKYHHGGSTVFLSSRARLVSGPTGQSSQTLDQLPVDMESVDRLRTPWMGW